MQYQPERPDRALAEAVKMTAVDGLRRSIVNAHSETLWDIEPDTKVDDDDLTYPVIVITRGGTYTSESIVLIATPT